jgi:hypothetical protein
MHYKYIILYRLSKALVRSVLFGVVDPDPFSLELLRSDLDPELLDRIGSDLFDKKSVPIILRFFS